MTRYFIRYQVKNTTKNLGEYTMSIGIDAKDLKSAKHKIETMLAKEENKKRPISRQIKVKRIDIIDYSVIGYY